MSALNIHEESAELGNIGFVDYQVSDKSDFSVKMKCYVLHV